MIKLPSQVNKFLRSTPWLIPALKYIFFTLLLLLFAISVKKTIHFLSQKGLTASNFISFTKSPQEILDSTNNRTNFLILGMRGGEDDSPDLSDTMILVSFNHQDNQISLLSIPRDLWVESLKTKINAVYHYGSLREEEDARFALTQAAVQETLGLPVHYIVTIDFKAFSDAINLLGGLEINVENGFVDKEFPIPGKENVFPLSDRYETIEFQPGPQTMNGETALKFVRSRNAQGDEGTDFARSRRQQLVISSLRQQILSSGILLNQQKVSLLIDSFSRHISTNLSPETYPALAKIAWLSRGGELTNIHLSSQSQDDEIAILEVGPPQLYEGQWVLVARDNNWEALKQYIQNKLNHKQ